MPRWIACLIGIGVIIVLILLLFPLVPAPGSTILIVLGWVVAAILFIMMVIDLVGYGRRV